MDLVLKNIGLLATPVGSGAKKGEGQRDILLIPDAEIGVKDGKIAYVKQIKQGDGSGAFPRPLKPSTAVEDLSHPGLLMLIRILFSVDGGRKNWRSSLKGSRILIFSRAGEVYLAQLSIHGLQVMWNWLKGEERFCQRCCSLVLLLVKLRVVTD